MTDENGRVDINELAGIVRDINDSYLDGDISKDQRDRQLVGAQAVLDSHGWTWDQLNDVITGQAHAERPAAVSDPAFPSSGPRLDAHQQQSPPSAPPPGRAPGASTPPPAARR